MNIDEMNDFEFCEILKQCMERLEKEGSYSTLLEIPYSKCVILIDNDDEINDQLSFEKHGWFDFRLMIKFNKRIKL